MKEPISEPLARRAVNTRMAAFAAGATMPLLTTPVRAHTDKPHGPKTGPMIKDQKGWGIASDAKDAERSIKVGKGDNMLACLIAGHYQGGMVVTVQVGSGVKA